MLNLNFNLRHKARSLQAGYTLPHESPIARSKRIHRFDAGPNTSDKGGGGGVFGGYGTDIILCAVLFKGVISVGRVAFGDGKGYCIVGIGPQNKI